MPEAQPGQRSAAAVEPSALCLGTCPECGAPAEITHRRSLASHQGLVEHGRVHCAVGHRFVMPLEGVEGRDG